MSEEKEGRETCEVCGKAATKKVEKELRIYNHDGDGWQLDSDYMDGLDKTYCDDCFVDTAEL
jgi:hypothetical protein